MRKSLCAEFIQFQIMERRDGCVYRTEEIKRQWFPLGQSPKLNYEDEQGRFWSATSTSLEWRQVT